MTDDGHVLAHSCELEYINLSSPFKQKVAKVELLLSRGEAEDLLRVLNVDKSSSKEPLEVVPLNSIASAVLVKLGQGRVIKKPSRQCLILFWRSKEPAQWNQLIIVDKDNKPAQFNCVKQLKTKLSEICFASSYQLTSPNNGSTHELQFSTDYVALVPGDESQHCENSNITDFTATITSDHIFSKAYNELTLQQESSNGLTTPDNCLKFKVMKSNESMKSLSYIAPDSVAAKSIAQELTTMRVKPLPPTPKGGSNNGSLTDEDDFIHDSTCGRIPPLNEAPFWISNLRCRPSSIYGNLPGDYRDELLNHETRRQEVCQREPKRRFKMFVTAVSLKPTMLKVAEKAASKRLYDIPTLAVEVTTPIEEVDTSGDNDNVESTFASFLNKVLRNTFRPDQLESCPIGLSRHEREQFCWRLDLIEYDVISGPGWKCFAQIVMQLDNDDLEMVDEFSCKYKCQVVEVVLDHWHKLYKMNSTKCTQPATKRTIIKVLHEMEKDALLKHLHWENEQY